MDWIEEQKLLCEHHGASYVESPVMFKIGISKNVKDRLYPINGLRHPLEGDTTGWYIWAGDYSEDPDFFIPLHVAHLEEWCPMAIKFLGLPPGWRFLVAHDYEYVWDDPSLLNISD
jgi:hypothetical protein